MSNRTGKKKQHQACDRLKHSPLLEESHLLTAAKQLGPNTGGSILPTSKTIDGGSLKYPEGKAQMCLYRVEIPVGGKIPLHKHPAPMMVYVQSENSGSLRNTQVMSNGSKIETIFKPGEAFLKEIDVPHYGKSISNKPTILWVTVTSVEGLPTTIFLD